jgi:hypothetical protein
VVSILPPAVDRRRSELSCAFDDRCPVGDKSFDAGGERQHRSAPVITMGDSGDHDAAIWVITMGDMRVQKSPSTPRCKSEASEHTFRVS